MELLSNMWALMQIELEKRQREAIRKMRGLWLLWLPLVAGQWYR